MAYNNQGYYNGQRPQQPRYQDEFVENPTNGFNPGYTQGAGAGSSPWTNGENYAIYQSPAEAPQSPPLPYSNQPQSPNAHSQSTYSYSDHMPTYQDNRQAQAYNPQQYSQPVSQYNPQAYAPVNQAYTAGQQNYNPAAYAEPYGRSQSSGSLPHNSYSPAQYPSPIPSNAGSYGHSSPAPAQYQFGQHNTPPMGFSQHPGFNSQYATQPEPSHVQTYSTYSRPAPQMASSYPVSPPEQLPYPEYEYQTTQTTMPLPQPPYPSVSPAMPSLPHEHSLPSPPIYSPYASTQSLERQRNDRHSVSPLYSPDARTPDVEPTATTQSIHRTDTLSRHPQQRPLPGPPEPYDRTDYDDELLAQEELYDEVENAIMNAGSPAALPPSSPRVGSNGSPSITSRPAPLFGSHRRNGRSSSTANGHLSPGPLRQSAAENSDSDAEALAGLQAMQAAEEEEAADLRRRQSGASGLYSGYNSQRHSGHRATSRGDNENDDYATVDMGLVGGGYEAHMSYGDVNGTGTYSQPASSAGSMRRPHGREGSYDYGVDHLAYNSAARVDHGGTGGLSDPSALRRRQSYDEGDEYAFTEDNSVPGEPPDLFYHPDVSPYRPLPPPPPSSSDASVQGIDTSVGGQPPYPLAPDAYVQSTTTPGTWVLRTTSLVNQSTTPPVTQPIRSKTDAEERQRRQGFRGSVYSNFDITPATSAVAIDLPSLPTKRFNPAKLGAADFKKCDEPWAMGSILRWLRQVADPEQMTELKESMIKEALVALFTNKVPTMNIADAEALSNRVVENMFSSGVLRTTEEWVRFCPGGMSGVIFQLTRSGCYSPTLHDHLIGGRCYSHHCQRTLKKVNLQATPARAQVDWATFYNLKKEDVEGVDKHEIERQNILHEIVQTEDGYIEQLNVLRQLYRDDLANAEPAVINPKRLKPFLRDVFGKVEAIKKANEDHLLAQLKYRQDEQGPWVKGFSDIFRQWIRKAKLAYVEYAAGFPSATLLMRQELERNLDFRTFVERARSQKSSNKLGWDTYLKAPITRLQRYSLLLFTVHKSMKQESEEKSNLQIAIDEIKAATMECDARVAEMQRKVDLADLSQKLMLRPGMQQDVELNLNHLGRELIYQGDLQRAGGTRFNWVECHALLFDHYLILAKAISVLVKGSTGKVEKFDVSRLPIPMDLLVLESINDDPVMKSTYVRGLTSVSAVPRSAGTPDPNRLGRTTTNTQSPVPGAFDRVNTANSINSMHSSASAPPAIASATITEASKDSDKIMYPIRIKHLGREPYVLFAPSAANRAEWGAKIIEAKTRHANSLYAQHAEPFRLRVIADSAFYYDYSLGGVASSGGGKSIVIEGTPMDRAVKEVERKFKDTGRPGPVCRARVNCGTSFTTPYPGKQMVAIGTDYGVYACEVDNPRGWFKSINIPKVTQIAVLEEFNLFLLISSGALIAYHLDVICSTDRVNGAATTSADTGSSRKAPQKLSGSRDVGFFAVGRMKERTLVFYKKRDGLSSTFKVLEPVYQKSTEKKRGMFKRGATEFFREYDEFYIPTECSGINLFHSSLAVSTNRGFEVLTLDKKQSFSVPDLKAPEVANIAQHIENQNALGMLRISDQEFLLCYEKCAVYVNKHGDVSRSVIMNFVGRARCAALHGAYLILFDADFIEIRNAQNGRLKQIIAGRDVKCLDDGGGGTISGGSLQSGAGVNNNGGPAAAGAATTGGGAGGSNRSVKAVMQHPENERVQVVVELVLNEGSKDG